MKVQLLLCWCSLSHGIKDKRIRNNLLQEAEILRTRTHFVCSHVNFVFLLCMLECCACTLSCDFSVVRGVSWWMSGPVVDKSAGRSHTFTVQSWLPDTMKEAFILDTNTWKYGQSLPITLFFWTCLCWGVWIRNVCVLECEALPGAADGPHGVSVAAALCHTAHLTAVTIHLPHAHWPVLKKKDTTHKYYSWLKSVCL